MKVLSYQPFLRSFAVSTESGGKDRSVLYIMHALAKSGHDLYILPPFEQEMIAQRFSSYLRDNSAVATVLPNYSLCSDLLSTVLPEWAEAYLHDLKTCLGSLQSATQAELPPKIERPSMGRPEIERLALRTAINDACPDVVHIHESYSAVAKLYREGGHRPPLLLTHHSGGLTPTLPLYDRIVFVSESQRKAGIARYPEIAARTTLIRYFASDPFLTSPLNSRVKKQIFFVGLVKDDRKGLALLLQTYLSEPKLQRYPLTIVGFGKEMDRCRRDFTWQHTNISFKGRLDDDAIAALFAEGGVFVMPSRMEGLALVYSEALCMGVPLVGFPDNINELGDILEEDIGFPHDPDKNSAADLADKILSALHSETYAASKWRLRVSGKARKHFNHARFTNDYLHLYEQIKKDSATAVSCKDTSAGNNLEGWSPVSRCNQEDAWLRAYLQARFDLLFAKHEKLCLFGAGKHTRWLLSKATPEMTGRITAVLDDQTKPGMSIASIPVLAPDEMHSPGVIVLSTDDPDTLEKMLARCAEVWGTAVEIIPIYKNVPRGPYRKVR
jgi:glycosyltransferase involved in cell wall biosynthesis